MWLSAVGAKGWVVITKDKAIRHRGTEIETLKRAGVAAFVLTKGGTGPENGAVLARALPKMLRYIIGNRPPFIAAVTPGSRLKMLYRGRKRRARTPKKE